MGYSPSQSNPNPNLDDMALPIACYISADRYFVNEKINLVLIKHMILVELVNNITFHYS